MPKIDFKLLNETISLNAQNIGIAEADRRVVYRYIRGGTENRHIATDLKISVDWPDLDETETAYLGIVWNALRRGESVLVSVEDSVITDIEMVLDTEERNAWSVRIGRSVSQQLRLTSRHDYKSLDPDRYGVSVWGIFKWA